MRAAASNGSARRRAAASVEIGGRRQEKTLRVPDHAEAVRQCLAQLTDPRDRLPEGRGRGLGDRASRRCTAGAISGVQRVTPDVLAAMEEMNDVAPAHNPPYITAMRLLSEKLPEIPLVAAFETDFHHTIPDRNRYYAVPYEWAENGLVRRYGFHGASHRYIATRTAELLGRDDLRIISCHLGGSSSLCAIRDGKSVATSMGISAAERPAAEQPRRRFRPVRPAGRHEADRQVARRGARRCWPTRAACWA